MRGCGQRSGVGRIEEFTESVKEVGIASQEVGLAGQHGHHIAPGDVTAQREQLSAHAVAQEPGILVRGVLDDPKPQVTAERCRFTPTEAEQRVTRPGPDASQTMDTGSSKQVGQDCLGLIVGRVTGRRIWTQDQAASVAGTGLEVRTVDEHHPLGTERRPQPVGCGRDDTGLVGRPGAQPVVHVDRSRPTPCGHCEGE